MKVKFDNKKILVFHSDSNKRDKLLRLLSGLGTGLKIKDIEKGEDAIAELENHTYDLHILESIPIAKKLMSTPLPQDPCILIGEQQQLELICKSMGQRPSNPPVFLASDFKMIDFLSAVEQALTTQEASHTNEYSPLKIEFFEQTGSLPIDLYLKLGKEKYVRFYRKDESGLGDKVISYKNRGMSILYCRTCDIDAINEEILRDGSLEEQVKENLIPQSSSSIGFIQDALLSFGFSKFELGVADDLMSQTKQQVKSEKLVTLLEGFSPEENKFVYEHSYLTSVFCIAIAKRINWLTTKEQEKLCQASYFHDLAIDEGQSAMPELNYYKASYPQKDLKLANHPLETAALLMNCNEISSDVVNIVKYHHLSLPPGNYNEKLSLNNHPPLVQVFVIAHEFVLALYRKAFRLDKHKVIVEELKDQFTGGKLEEITAALEASLSS
jgi:hypothetical protein